MLAAMASGICPERLLSDRSRYVTLVAALARTAPVMLLPWRSSQKSTGKAARLSASSVPWRPALGRMSPVTRPAVSHLMPDQEHVGRVGDHVGREVDDDDFSPLLAGSRVDFHRRSDSASFSSMAPDVAELEHKDGGV
jgi:hypothetical protein